MKRKEYILFIIFFCLLSIPSVSFAQSRGINVGFASKSSVFKSEGVLHNMVKISNETTKLYRFRIELLPPGGWKHVGSSVREISIAAGDSLFLPVNIIPNAAIRGGDVYICNVRVYTDDFMIGNDNWIITVEKISDLKVIPEDNRFWFHDGRDSTSFKLSIFNYGNAEENMVFKLSSIRNQLGVYNELWKKVDETQLSLKPGEDTTLVYNVAINRKFSGEQEYDVLKRKDNIDNYSLRLKMLNREAQNGPALWKNNLIFTKAPSRYRENLTGSITLPLSLQMDVYNVLQSSTYMSLQAAGNTTFNDVNELTYFYQTNFNTNIFDANALLGDYSFAGFYTPKYFGEIGNVVTNREGASISGKGIRGGYDFGNHEVKAGIMANPSLFDIRRWGASAEYVYNAPNKRLKTSLFGLYEDNYDVNQRNITGIPMVSYRIGNDHFLRASGGYNTRTYALDSANPFLKQGLGLRLGYSGRIKQFTVSASGRYGSPTYEPSPGSFQLTGNMGYFHGGNLQSRLLLSHFSSRPDVYANTGELIQTGLRSRSNQVEYKISKNQEYGVLSGSAYYRQRLYRNLFMKHEGVGLGYFQRYSRSMRVNASLNMDMNQLPEMPEKGSFFTSRLKTSFRFGDNSMLNLRYHYGPFYYYEFDEFAETNENPQSVFINGYMDKWFAKNRLLGRLNGNYNYRLKKDHHILNSRPELFYFTKNGLRFNLYANISYLQKSYFLDTEGLQSGTSKSFNIETGFGVKKDFGVPISRKRYFDAHFEAFEDVNGNGIRDRGEIGIQNILVQMIPEQVLGEDGEESTSTGFYHILTNKKGNGIVDNVQAGRYAVVIQPLEKQNSILAIDMEQLELFNDKTIMLPFATGGVVTGAVSIEKARFSQFEDGVNVANIRVSVRDQSGREYSALTNANGIFEIYVPVGVYVVSINQQVFGKSFAVMQNNKTIQLTQESNKAFINFYVKEVERKLNIKRF